LPSFIYLFTCLGNKYNGKEAPKNWVDPLDEGKERKTERERGRNEK
jgi:hypothetical protein